MLTGHRSLDVVDRKSMPPRVNYDHIAPSYDARYAPGAYDDMQEALRAFIMPENPERVLEVGCGTGHWLDVLRDLVPNIFGLDYSLEMLNKARAKDPHGCLLRATAELAPFRDRTFDVIFCINAIHHFERVDEFVAGARRLLRPGGSLAIFGMDPHHGGDSWCVYDFFPETRTIDLARYPSSGKIADAMLRAGFDSVECRVSGRFAASRVGQAVFDDPELQRRGCSQMALLTDVQYAAGIQRIKSAIRNAGSDEPPVFKADIAMIMQCGRV
ncbi:class I SAM-dependent methyltransferase, partial [Candidatus Binatus sp.]|uniref:class I SAM-dependent methyltransferase n=1 Tax=Candidatus Binatus sp. TaxID=2811406 RepID=UPI003CC643C6